MVRRLRDPAGISRDRHAIEAGLDMFMLPFDYKSFTGYVDQALANGDLTQARVDDAARRILRAKFRAGLFDRKLADGSQLSKVGFRRAPRAGARGGAEIAGAPEERGSVLPLNKETRRIRVAGFGRPQHRPPVRRLTVEWQASTATGFPHDHPRRHQERVSDGAEVEYDSTELHAARAARRRRHRRVGEAPYSEGYATANTPR